MSTPQLPATARGEHRPVDEGVEAMAAMYRDMKRPGEQEYSRPFERPTHLDVPLHVQQEKQKQQQQQRLQQQHEQEQEHQKEWDERHQQQESQKHDDVSSSFVSTLRTLSESLEEQKQQATQQASRVQDIVRGMDQQGICLANLSSESERLRQQLDEMRDIVAEAHRSASSQHRAQAEQLKDLCSEASVLRSQQQEQAALLRSAGTQSQQQQWEGACSSTYALEQVQELRIEQRAALSGQVALLRREFEAAYRAEQMAGSALDRIASVEEALAQARAESAKEGPEALHLRCQLSEVAATMARQQDRLARLEDKLGAVSNLRDEQLANTVRPCWQALHNLEETAASWGRGFVTTSELQDFQASVTRELAATREFAIEQSEKCARVLAEGRAAWSQSAAGFYSERSSASQKDRDEPSELAELRSSLTKELAVTGRSAAKCREDLARELEVEREARAREDADLRIELAEAISVIKSQFEAWTTLVGITRSELSQLSASMPARGSAAGGAAAAASASSLDQHREELIARALHAARLEWQGEIAALRARVDAASRQPGSSSLGAAALTGKEREAWASASSEPAKRAEEDCLLARRSALQAVESMAATAHRAAGRVARQPHN